jgi:hypothetical protein
MPGAGEAAAGDNGYALKWHAEQLSVYTLFSLANPCSDKFVGFAQQPLQPLQWQVP